MKVWDLPTRLYHWLQALVFIGIVITGKTGEGPHFELGLLLFTLLVWRILWGIWGSQTNRLLPLIQSPKSVVAYLRGRAKPLVGHNPAGGWMVLVLLSSLLMQCISGMALAGVLDTLPYSHVWLTDDLFLFLENTHLFLADYLPWLIGIHVLAILVYKLKGTALVKAMITGHQEAPEGEKEPKFEPSYKAALLFIAALLLTYLLSRGV